MAATRKTTATRTRNSKAAQDAAAHVECASCLEIAQAEALLAQVRAALDQPDPVQVKADKVETITTPCIQVFCALAAALRERDQAIEWVSPSAKLTEVAGMLGVSAQLGLSG